jgi:hypothetical protein
VAKQRCAYEVAVEGRDSLARIYISELHEWGLVLRLQNERHPEIELRKDEMRAKRSKRTPRSYLGHMLVFLIFLAIVIYQRTSHAEIRYDWRVLFLSPRKT